MAIRVAHRDVAMVSFDVRLGDTPFKIRPVDCSPSRLYSVHIANSDDIDSSSIVRALIRISTDGATAIHVSKLYDSYDAMLLMNIESVFPLLLVATLLSCT